MTNNAKFQLDNFSSSFLNESLNLDGSEVLDLDEDLSKIGITQLTQIMSSLAALACVIGMIGNIFSIIVLNRKAMKKLSTYTYLLGLSVCDVINLTLTLIIMIHYVLPSNAALNSFKSTLKIMLLYIYPIVYSMQALSVWITLAFTVDRYLFICHPYYGREYCTRKRAFCVLAFLFILATVYSIPLFFEKSYIIVDILPNNKQVFHTYSALGQNKYFIYIYHLFIYSTFICFIPIILIIILNMFLVNDIIKSNKRHRELNIYASSHKSQSSIMIRRDTTNTTNNNNRTFLLKTPVKFLPLYGWCFFNKSKGEVGLEIVDLETSPSTEPCLAKNNSIHLNGMGGEPSYSLSSNKKRSTVSDHVKTSSSFSTTTTAGIHNTHSDHTIRNDVGIMLAGLIICFLICQLPSAILRLITFRNLSLYFQPVYYSSLDISNFLIVINSVLNAFLYIMLGKKFRREFLKCFCSYCSDPNLHGIT
jgi:hypothetical protein